MIYHQNLVWNTCTNGVLVDVTLLFEPEALDGDDFSNEHYCEKKKEFIFRLAFSFGVNVFYEKPMAINVEQAQGMIKAKIRRVKS